MGLVKQKLISIPAETWEQIESYASATGLSAQAAILSLIGLGLIRNRETVEALGRRQKGKKR